MGVTNNMTATGSKGRVDGGKRVPGGHIPEGDSDPKHATETSMPTGREAGDDGRRKHRPLKAGCAE